MDDKPAPAVPEEPVLAAPSKEQIAAATAAKLREAQKLRRRGYTLVAGVVIAALVLFFVGRAYFRHLEATSGTCALASLSAELIAVGLRQGEDANEIVTAVGAGSLGVACEKAVKKWVDDPYVDAQVKLAGEKARSVTGSQIQQLPPPSPMIDNVQLTHSFNCILAYSTNTFLEQECFDYLVNP